MSVRWENIGWTVANILVPIFAPIVVCLFGRMGTHGPNRQRLRPLFLVKDGQLGWIATALCAVAIYETYEIKDGGAWAVAVMAVMGLIGLFSTIFAVEGITNPVPFPMYSRDHWRPLYATIFVVWVSAVGLLTIHFRREYYSLLVRVFGLTS